MNTLTISVQVITKTVVISVKVSSYGLTEDKRLATRCKFLLQYLSSELLLISLWWHHLVQNAKAHGPNNPNLSLFWGDTLTNDQHWLKFLILADLLIIRMLLIFVHCWQLIICCSLLTFHHVLLMFAHCSSSFRVTS